MFILTAIIGIGEAQGELQPGDFLVVDYDAEGGTGALYLARRNDQEWLVFSTGQYFQDPVDVVCDELGRIFVADGTAAAIIEVDAQSGAQRIVSQSGIFLHPVSLVTGTGNDLVVCDTGAKSIVRVDKDSGAQELIFAGPPLISPFAITRDESGTLYVLDRVANDAGSVFRVDGTGAILVSTGQHFQQIMDLAVGPGTPGTLYVVGPRQNLIGIVLSLPADANQSIVASSGGGVGVVSGPSNGANYVYVLTAYRSSAIVEVDPVTGASGTFSWSGGLRTAFGIAVYPEHPPIQVMESTWGRIKDMFR